MLRRTKAIIADQLPRKREHIVFCQLAPLQQRAYARLLACPDLQLLARAEERCGCGSGEVRARCCHTAATAEQGGVLWPALHECGCSNAWNPFSNPEGCKRHKQEVGGCVCVWVWGVECRCGCGV